MTIPEPAAMMLLLLLGAAALKNRQ
ncbi:PEP-CTERM sorting domain-containing protein [bacterium]|nr:PEP-CTERM sorting domain-containing protein [bacterium]